MERCTSTDGGFQCMLTEGHQDDQIPHRAARATGGVHFWGKHAEAARAPQLGEEEETSQDAEESPKKRTKKRGKKKATK